MKKTFIALVIATLAAFESYAQAPAKDSVGTDSVEAFRKQDLKEVNVVGRKKTGGAEN